MDGLHIVLDKKKKIVISAVLSAIAVIYIAVHVITSFLPKTELYTVRAAEFEESEIFSGYIFRDDKAITYSGGMTEIIVSDGAKIAADTRIASIYPSLDETLAGEIKELEKQIKILGESELTGDISLSALDAQINALKIQMAKKADEGNYLWVSDRREELDVLMCKRALAAAGKRDYSEKIASLGAELEDKKSLAGKASASVICDESGYFSAYCDGYEGMLTRDKALDVTAYNYDEIALTEKTDYTNVLGTLITDFRWYFLCKTDIESSEDYLSGNSYECCFVDGSSETSFMMKLEYKSINYSDGTVVMRFYSGDVPVSSGASRERRIKIIQSKKSGLCVPSSAVRVIDGKTFVYIFKKGIARLREVNILGERNGLYIVDGETSGENAVILLNDLVIINEKNLYEGKIVG